MRLYKKLKMSTVEVEFLPSKIIATANIGEKLSEVAAAAKVKINYKCKKGCVIVVYQVFS